MAKPLSPDLRKRVIVAVVKEDMSRHQAAARFNVGIATVIRWVAKFLKTGSMEPDKMGGRRPKNIRGEHEIFLRQRIKAGNFMLRGLVIEIADRDCKADYRSVWNFVHAEKQSYKKTVLASEQDRPDVARRREQGVSTAIA
jgi:transposase